MDILKSKNIINEEINHIFQSYQENLIQKDIRIQDIEKKSEIILNTNSLLLNEINQKDKYLLQNDLKIYEIESIVQRKLREIELNKNKYNLQEKGFQFLNNFIVELDDLCKKDKVYTPEDVVKEKHPTQTTNHNMEEEEEENRESSINEGDIIMNTIKKDDGSIKEIINDIIETEDLPKIEDEQSSSEEEEVIVSTIKYYGKEYYIIDGKTPQYIYAIDGDELGEIKGEIIEGKKHLYKK